MHSRTVLGVAVGMLLVTSLAAIGVDADERLVLRSGALSGPQDVSWIAPTLRLDEAELASGGPALLKFRGSISRAAREEASARGIRLCAPLGRGGFLAWLPPGGLATTSGLDRLAWAAPYHPGLKLAPEVAAVGSDDPRDTFPVTVHVFSHADVVELARRLEALGVSPVGAAAGRPAAGRLAERCGRLVLTPSPEQLVTVRDVIARWPETVWIGRRPTYRLLNDASAWVMQSGLSGGQTTPVYDHGILGDGQVVGVLDTGLDADMCYYRDELLGLPPTHIGSDGVGSPDPNQRKVLIVDFLWNQDDPEDVTDWDSHDHGTHVAGSVAGDDLATLGERDAGDGMAPRAKLVIQDGGYQVDDCADLPALGCPVVDLVPIFQQAYDQGARLHTNSWGDRENFSPPNIYSDGSEDADEVMWTHPDYLLLFAAGNSGPSADTVGSPATAKNVVAVGATAHGSSAGSIASFSSRGKTEDGRIKPDVMAPGSGVVSADNDGNVETDNCSTRSMSGTSMASPTAAGLAALVREYFDKGFYPEGAESPADAFVPSAALIKATLIASATPMENLSSPPPSDDQGWGRILLDDALYFPGDTQRLFVVDEAEGFAASGEEPHEHWIEVVDSSKPLKIVLVWTDYPSSPAAGTNLVNDLDLEIVDPEGTTYRGNSFVDGFTPPGGAADRLNNVEVIKIDSPAVGFWSVLITPHEVQQPEQAYAVVATGGLGEAEPPAAGRARFDGSTYGCDGLIGARVIDGNAIGPTVTARVWSETEPEPERMTLEEAEPGIGRFFGNIASTSAPPVHGDDQVSLTDDDTISLEYLDDDDGAGGQSMSFDIATADCRGPMISDLRVESITDQRLSVRFETDEPGDAVVEWGPTPTLGETVTVSELKTNHSVIVNRLAPCEAYHLRVRSHDRFHNTAIADNGGAPHTLHTWQIPGLYWQETFEGDVSGWTLVGEWEVGAPQGLGNSSGSWHPDPTQAYNNVMSLGNDLSGRGDYPGDYEPNASESAQSPPQDATDWSHTELIVHKQLNVHADDSATIVAYTDGTTPLYGNESTTISDSGFERLRFDIAKFIDGRPSVGVAFGLVADGQTQASGWNIDDVIFKDGTLPDYDVCGGCGQPPSFGGATAATDNDACAADGVTVSWNRAVSWGTGSDGTYALYRDTSSGFTPSAANRIAAGLDDLSYNDAATPTDQSLYYLVRAENDENCASGPNNGGTVDENEVYAAVNETTTQPLPAGIDTLSVALRGHVHVRLEWDAIEHGSEYRIYRSSTPEPADFAQIDAAIDSAYEDLGAGVDGETWFYLVRAANACGQEGP
ncbi:MAG: S8 family serine peptidase [Acidobacteriota bacterium]|nr:MAG: S8 family serine peptidase [Acidobacteriota bacterium]